MATDADIKKAYRKESLKHHPDKVGFTSYFDDSLLTNNLGW
jgi:preprotein translocase subunit Sec63